MSWLKKLFGGGKADQPHEGHENCPGGVCEPAKEEAPAAEATPAAAPEEAAPAAEEMSAEGGEEEVAEQDGEDKPL